MGISRLLPVAACGLLLAAGACFSRVKTSTRADVAGAALDRRELAEETVSHWSNVSALAARRLMEEYGTPDEVHSGYLVWRRNGPWRRTVALNTRPGFGPIGAGGLGVIEQSVGYAATPAEAGAVAAFGERVNYDPRAQALYSRSDTEAHNFLRLNLADDVARGRLSPQAARESFASIIEFQAAGKSSPYLLGLRFATGVP